jgi:T5SS/PEP-CTERM-associated repeat protein/autotransporter-associated beta strand protein
MKRNLLLLLGVAVLAFAPSLRAQFIWSGLSPFSGSTQDLLNWQLHLPLVPVGDGTEDAVFGDILGSQTNVIIPTSGFNNITFNGSSRPAYTFSGVTAGQTLTVNGTITVGAGAIPVVNSDLAVVIAGVTRTVDVATGATLQINGIISGPAALTKSGGGTLALGGNNTYTGGTTVSAGTLYVGAGGAIAHNSSPLTLGSSGGSSGSMTIEAGGKVADSIGTLGSVATSFGSLVVKDLNSAFNNSTYLYVGAGGQGALFVLNGATVTSANTSIGNLATGSGQVTVDGLGSTLTNSANLYVGSAGYGSLAITNGGTVSNVTGSIGNNAGGNGVASVSGSGSVWTNTSDLNIGYATTGLLSISGGGVVNSANGYLGTLAAGAGTVHLTDAGSAWNVGNTLFVGFAGSGTVSLAANSALNVNGGAGTVYLGFGGSTAQLVFGVGGTDHGGYLNAGTITGGAASSVVFNTNSTSANPFYLTRNGTSSGVPVVVAGSTTVTSLSGYNVLSGGNAYGGGTQITGGTIVANSNNALAFGTVTLGSGGKLSVASGVTVTNAIDLTAGGTLGGTGTFAPAAPVSIGAFDTVAPGFSPGTLTFSTGLHFASSGTLEFEVQSAAGAAGIGYDLVSVSGALLNITASPVSPFTISVLSLNSGGTAGNVADFSSANPYSWTIATSTAGITGFAANKFLIDTSGFSNSLGGGSFYLSTNANNLQLNFTPVPEPSTYALIAVGLGAITLLRRRRRA